MRVGIDESRKQGQAAKVDDLRAWRDRRVGANARNSPALNDDDRVLHDISALRIDHASGANDGRRAGSRRSLGSAIGSDGGHSQSANESREASPDGSNHMTSSE